MSKLKFSPCYCHVTFFSSLLLEVGGESQPQCADLCLPHVPALIYRGNYHRNCSPLHSENSRSQSDIKTSSSYIFCCAQEAHKHSRTQALLSVRTAEET